MAKGNALEVTINVALLERLQGYAETLIYLQQANVFELAASAQTQVEKDFKVAEKEIARVRCGKAQTYKNRLKAKPLSDEERKTRDQKSQEDQYERN
tara:strand:+ start:510 stop:800 length:291 start_codon:yes stop_codon:yes gene_type:complete